MHGSKNLNCLISLDCNTARPS